MSQLQERAIGFEAPAEWVAVASAAEIFAGGQKTVHVGSNVIALFVFDGQIYAVDNRCPHMGFPLDKGSVRDGILTCHWHHARFDLCSGGTFDLWADDVRSFGVKIEDEQVWVDVAPQGDARARQRKRLNDGLERNIRLVIAKSTLGLMSGQTDSLAAAADPFRIGLLFAARNRRDGWSTGATILTVMQNLLPHLNEDDRSRALYTGLTAIARDCDGQPARFAIEPLPNQESDLASLKRWFRRFVEVRDTQGAERCIVTAIQAGYNDRQLADIFFAAATDHRYIDTGHPLDFTNKTFEALDWTGWQPEIAAPVLASLVPNFTGAQRMEEANEWRNPIDLVELLETTFTKFDAVVPANWAEQGGPLPFEIVETLLGDDPQAIVDTLLESLKQGTSFEQLAGVVAYTAARRVVHYGITNEYPDWNTVHHTYTYANAVHQGMRRAPSVELLRGVFDAAMSIYLDRFLNTPPTKIPEPTAEEIGAVTNPAALLEQLLTLLDKQQPVNEAARLVATYLAAGGSPAELRATLGKALLREDAGFHPIQSLEASFRQYDLLRERPGGAEAANHVLLAAIRYLAAHSPTARSANQTYQIALRLNRGEKVFE